MWRSLLTSLVRPRKVSLAWGSGKCSPLSQRFESRSAHWTADEDRKLTELRQQGWEYSKIASVISDRSLTAVVRRSNILKLEKTARQPRAKTTPRSWSAQEEAFLLEMMQQGLTSYEMAACLPGRTFYSIEKHIANRETWTSGQRRKNRSYADADIQRMIHMRLEEARTYRQIAHEFKCSRESVIELWHGRCLPLVSKEAQELISIRTQRLWSQKENDHLLNLHRKGVLSIRDAALQFPSKSLANVRARCSRLLLAFPRRTKTPEVGCSGVRMKRKQHSTAGSKAQAKSLSQL